jgi:hypothetical protein
MRVAASTQSSAPLTLTQDEFSSFMELSIENVIHAALAKCR